MVIRPFPSHISIKTLLDENMLDEMYIFIDLAATGSFNITIYI